jgi:hypothetical protein
MADVREIRVRLGDDHWVRVDEMIFRSWTGPRRLNGEKYTGPVFLLGSDTWAWKEPDHHPRCSLNGDTMSSDFFDPEVCTCDELKEREWETEELTARSENFQAWLEGTE